MRKFSTGATRNVDVSKPDPEGFLSPIVINVYSEYMQKNTIQDDGVRRGSDNWQKGIPIDSYMKSLWRHFLDLWTLHRGFIPNSKVDKKEALCAVLFNVHGYLFEIVKQEMKDNKMIEEFKFSLIEFIDDNYWRVFSKNGFTLGYIIYHSEWKKLVFNPVPEIVLDTDVMTEISAYINQVTK